VVWLLTRAASLLGRRTDDALDRGWTRTAGWIARRQRERSDTRQSAAVQKREAKRIQLLTRERVGTHSRFRTSSNDLGMDGEVVDLDSRDIEQRVVVVWTNPDGRPPTEYDYQVGTRISMEWRHLTLAPGEQRHRTARLIQHSADDSDGWVEFDRIDGDG
jgi:hypothetical protein